MSKELSVKIIYPQGKCVSIPDIILKYQMNAVLDVLSECDPQYKKDIINSAIGLLRGG